MKKTTSTFVLIIFIFTLSCGISFCQDIDLSGTWVGETEVPDQGTDELTLVLEKKEGEYTGTISDSLGMLDETECEDIEFEDSNLSFNFSIYDGYSNHDSVHNFDCRRRYNDWLLGNRRRQHRISKIRKRRIGSSPVCVDNRET